jgi:hypothetical protein
MCVHCPICASRLAHQGAPWRRGRSSRLVVSGKQVVPDTGLDTLDTPITTGQNPFEKLCRIVRVFNN